MRQEVFDMNGHTGGQPYFALVDDDLHSARLLMRMLTAHSAPTVIWQENASLALTELEGCLANDNASIPALVLVDLKSSSEATEQFVKQLHALPGASSLLVAAVAPSLERVRRDALLDAGADAVFQRHADLDFYRREAAAIISFWVRNQRLDAVGT